MVSTQNTQNTSLNSLMTCIFFPLNLRMKGFGFFGIYSLSMLSCILTPVRTQQLMYEFTVDSLWTWVGGSASIMNPPGSYGSRGVPSPSNVPDGRSNHQIVFDSASGNLYMFGGYGKSNITLSWGRFNDLWRWNSSSQMWTWLTGSMGINSIGNYGTFGIRSANNNPGARSNFGMAMNPKTSSIFVFGGFGYGTSFPGNLNDLWEWDPITTSWTWINGSSGVNSAGSYGMLGSAAPSNCPSGRQYVQMTIDTRNGNLYVFGGSSLSVMNDLWQWSPATKYWTWLSGDQTPGSDGNYGTRLVPAESNCPAARYYYSMAYNSNQGILYIFAGQKNSTADYNDLWQWNTTANLWTWLTGSSSVNRIGTYGAAGSYSELNSLPTQYGQSMTLNPLTGTLLVYGGYASSQYRTLSDVWMWDPKTNLWAWISGGKGGFYSPKHGTQNVPSSLNHPGWRWYHSVDINANTGDVFVFGGNSGNELWRFTPLTISCATGTVLSDKKCVDSCPPGRFNASHVCLPCNQGFYCPNGVSIACPVNSNTTGPGAASISSCLCVSQYYMNSNSQCTPCPLNSVCGNNIFVCNSGFTLNATSTGCSSCGANSYKPASGNIPCPPCPSNSVCNSSSFTCNTGFTLNGTSTGCTSCGLNSYKPTSGNHACNQCPLNSVCDGISFTCNSGFTVNALQNGCAPLSIRLSSSSSSTVPPSSMTVSVHRPVSSSVVSSSSRKTIQDSSPTVFRKQAQKIDWWNQMWKSDPIYILIILTSGWMCIMIIGIALGFVSAGKNNAKHMTSNMTPLFGITIQSRSSSMTGAPSSRSAMTNDERRRSSMTGAPKISHDE